MADFAEAFLNTDILLQAWRLLLKGLLQTVVLSAVALPLGLVTGLALALTSRAGPAIRIPAELFVDVFRVLSPLVLLIPHIAIINGPHRAPRNGA